jgi:hypothetical protein
MPWWLTALIYIGLTVVYELIRPKPRFDSPDPAGIGDFRVPTIGEGRVIPLAWGTVKIPGPMVVWYGDLDAIAVTKEVQTGWFSSEEITVGYRYYLGMDLVLCSGEIDAVLEVRFDDKPTCSGGTTITAQPAYDRTKIAIDCMGFFGGDEEEGGLNGDIYVYHGTRPQYLDGYLEDQKGSSIPTFAGVCHAVIAHMYLGMTPYLKTIAFVVRRCPNQLGLTDGDENIDGDANPAAMIYELLTAAPADNGLGLPEGEIDADSFRAVGATLADEGLGLSMIVERATTGKDLILEILRHIDGIMFVEPTSGLLTLTLVRNDYTVETLPVLDEDSCIVESFARSSWGEVKNQIRVTYVDRDGGFIERVVQAQDLASIEASGGEVSSQDIQYRGYSNAANAQAGAARALMGLSYPLAALTIVADRSAWAFRPGTVFKLDWPKLGIAGLVCRALRVSTGELRSGKVRIEAFEDIFAIDWTAYGSPGSSGWSNPSGTVPALEDQAALMAPYELVKFLSPPGGDVQRAATVAGRGSPGVTKGYRPLISGSGNAVQLMTPTGELLSAIDELDTTIEIDLGPDMDLLESINGYDFATGVNVLWIDDGTGPDQIGLEEFIAFQSVSIDTVLGKVTLTGIARGCLDTAPTSFAIDSRVWIISRGYGLAAASGSGNTSIVFQPYNNNGVLSVGSCITTIVSPQSVPRPNRVYCPTDVRFNSLSYPTSISGELTVSWEHRNRLGEWSYADSGETSEAEEGTTYQIRVYGELGTLIHTESDITGTSWVYDEDLEKSESGFEPPRLNTHLKIELRTFLGGDVSMRMIVWEFDRV